MWATEVCRCRLRTDLFEELRTVITIDASRMAVLAEQKEKHIDAFHAARHSDKGSRVDLERVPEVVTITRHTPVIDLKERCFCCSLVAIGITQCRPRTVLVIDCIGCARNRQSTLNISKRGTDISIPYCAQFQPVSLQLWGIA